MDLKLLGDLLKLELVDKNNSNNYKEKLDFNKYSEISLNFAKGISEKHYPENFSPHSLGNSMEIYIKDMKGREIPIKCSPTDKISWVKENFMIASNSLNNYPIFKYDGEILDDKKMLDFYEIEDGECIISTSKVIGGGPTEFYLDDDLLDPSYDYDFSEIKDKNEKYYRGGYEYKRPCGWKRYALKVSGKFENDLWLGETGKSNNDSEWAVSYHGTKQKFVDSISKNGLHPGDNNLYGVGIYCTPNIETAAEYAESFTGTDEKEYKIVFQNRVKPSAIKKASDKGGPADYWYIEDSKNIRPYSICIREEKNDKKNKNCQMF